MKKCAHKYFKVFTVLLSKLLPIRATYPCSMSTNNYYYFGKLDCYAFPIFELILKLKKHKIVNGISLMRVLPAGKISKDPEVNFLLLTVAKIYLL